MKPQFALITASFIVLTASFPAATGAREQSSRSRIAYDVKTEQTAQGVVEAIEAQPSPLMLTGGHLILATSGGKLDVHLGPAEPRSAGNYGLRVGDQIEVAGSMVHINGMPVLLARTIKRGSQILTLRNKLGFPLAARGAVRRPFEGADHSAGKAK